jgi:hypothetical protein
MVYLNQITNPEKLIEQKVNFFADYYNFVASQIEQSDYLDVDNYLSLIEKMIFQIETNLKKCSSHIDSYLTHPLIQKENKYFKEYKNYSLVSNLFEQYKKSGKKMYKWSNENPDFINSLKRFKTELKKVMFKHSLKEIISFLKCIHNIDEHKYDLIHHTNILVSEFLLNNKAKDDITDIFSKIITRDIDAFPFPPSFLKDNKNNLVEAKKEYLQNRTFDQQFEGIYHFLKEKPKVEYFIYRVYNINAQESFRFKYNQVTFYHPKHKKIEQLRPLIKKAHFLNDFLDKNDMILAIVKVNYSSKKIAEQDALRIINNELKFLNLKCGSNSFLETQSYLSTSNFKNLGWRWRAKEKGHFISTFNEKALDNNPYHLLRQANKLCKNYFLDCEQLYVKAENSKNPEEYWHYLETLIPLKSNGDKQVKDIISDLLTISSYNNKKGLIEDYIINSIANASAKELGISSVRYNQIKYSKTFDFNQLRKELSHPFLKYLFERLESVNTIDYECLKAYYKRIINECYAQRNSILHSNQGNEKALILIDSSLPKLMKRFRKVLFDGMLKYREFTFDKLINQLEIDANNLIKQNN